jgi:hypothetical protein
MSAMVNQAAGGVDDITTNWINMNMNDMNDKQSKVNTAIAKELEKIPPDVPSRIVVITGLARDNFLSESDKSIQVDNVVYLSQNDEASLERLSLMNYIKNSGEVYTLAASIGGSSTQAFPITNGSIEPPITFGFGAVKNNKDEILKFVQYITSNNAKVILYNAIGNAVGRSTEKIVRVFPDIAFQEDQKERELIQTKDESELQKYEYKTGLYKGVLPTKLTTNYINKNQHTNDSAVETVKLLCVELSEHKGDKSISVDVVNRIIDEDWGGSWLLSLGTDTYNELSSGQFVYYDKDGAKQKIGNISSNNAVKTLGGKRTHRKRNRKTRRRRSRRGRR